MLLTFIFLYLAVSIAIGLVAAMRVRNTRDFVLAGRTLPFYVVTATVFATWFGSETVLGISSTFIKEGLRGIVADPFGASMCLVLVGLFFAVRLYRMNLLTIGDYYRDRYNRPVEVVTSLCIALSYLGWVAAQVTALLGLVLDRRAFAFWDTRSRDWAVEPGDFELCVGSSSRDIRATARFALES